MKYDSGKVIRELIECSHDYDIYDSARKLMLDAALLIQALEVENITMKETAKWWFTRTDGVSDEE